ncbi:hypothetical protein M8C21_027473, partial [Ambrosia artemisiifolia]
MSQPQPTMVRIIGLQFKYMIQDKWSVCMENMTS